MTNQQHCNKQKEKNFIYMAKTNIYMQKQNKQIKSQTECLSTPPNLNDTLSPMWQEIHYSGMRTRDEQSPRRSPKLKHQNTYQKLTAIFSLKDQTSTS
jgi:hypothetical protein